ncbi:hypothetical protein [Kitasatospora sp. NPDC057223]|uniref:hypothetical protein n=1 Tax=Kitasatospora sp. NPDC057223 TaxID=3346055 RepID=UPI0036410973
MQSHRPGSTRLALTVGAVAVALALTACEPDNSVDAADAPVATAPAAATGTPAATAAVPPASKRQVTAAKTAGGLARYTGEGAVSDVAIDPGEMQPGMNLVVANYNRAGQATGRRILLVAVDGVPEDPNKRREHLWRGLIDYALDSGSTGTPGTGKAFSSGPLGGSVECLGLPEAATTDVICGWADGSTAAVALFPRTTLPEAAALFTAMRGDLEQ